MPLDNLPAVVRIAGVRFDFGSVTLIVPPMTLAAMEQMQYRIAGFKPGVDRQSVATIIDVTHAALARNYPQITRDDVAGLIDVGNMLDVFTCVMDVSGARRKAQEAEDSGKADGRSIGAASTPA